MKKRKVDYDNPPKNHKLYHRWDVLYRRHSGHTEEEIKELIELGRRERKRLKKHWKEQRFISRWINCIMKVYDAKSLQERLEYRKLATELKEEIDRRGIK